jgi:hypothetical protein
MMSFPAVQDFISHRLAKTTSSTTMSANGSRHVIIKETKTVFGGSNEKTNKTPSERIMLVAMGEVRWVVAGPTSSTNSYAVSLTVMAKKISKGKKRTGGGNNK